MPFMVTLKERIFTLTSYNFCISPLHLKLEMTTWSFEIASWAIQFSIGISLEFCETTIVATLVWKDVVIVPHPKYLA